MDPRYPATAPPPPPPGFYLVDEHESPTALVCPTCHQYGVTIIETKSRIKGLLSFFIRPMAHYKQRIQSVKHFCPYCRHTHRPLAPLGALGALQVHEERREEELKRKEEEMERKEEKREREEEKIERKEEKRKQKAEKRERKAEKREQKEEKRERKEMRRERKEQMRQRREERHYHRHHCHHRVPDMERPCRVPALRTPGLHLPPQSRHCCSGGYRPWRALPNLLL